VTSLDPHVGAALVEKLRAGRELSPADRRELADLVLETPGVERALLQREAVRQVEAVRRADPLLSFRAASALVARRFPVGSEAVRRWVRERGPFPQER
jgi:hypothetical protein